jgi:hypothetical protein
MAGRLDPDDSTGQVDTPWWTPTGDTGTASVLALPATAMTPDRWEAVGELRRTQAIWTISNHDRTAAKDTARTGLATAVTRPLQGGTPPSSQRLGALLSSDDFGSSVERKAHGQVLCRARMQAAEANVMECSTVSGYGKAEGRLTSDSEHVGGGLRMIGDHGEPSAGSGR